MDQGRSHRIRRRLLSLAHFIGLFLAMSLICLPGLWVVLNSFRPTVEIMAKPPVWIPTELNLDHYRAMFGGIGEGGVPVLTYFLNSLVISLTSTVIALLVGMAGGYAFARYRIHGQGGDLCRVDGVAAPCPAWRCRCPCSSCSDGLASSTRISA